MKITLFERWRRRGTAGRKTPKSHTRSRRMLLESLEHRAMLSASSVVKYSAYDVNHDNYLNVLDVVNLVSYINSHGSGPVDGASHAAASAGNQPSAALSSSSSSSSSGTNLDINDDGFINVLDIVSEVKALADVGATAQYALVATNAADQPLTGPVTVGDTFYIDVQVQDLRSVSYAGIAAANVAVNYTEQGGGTLAATPTGTVTSGASYPAPEGSSHGDATGTPGTIVGVQGAEDLNASGIPFYYNPLGTSALTLDRIQMTATAPGTMQFNTQSIAANGNYIVFAVGTGNNDPTQVPDNQVGPGSTSVTVLAVPPVPATLSGTVYVDQNGNGGQDSGELGLPGVTVQLFDSNNQLVGTPQVTDANGDYTFSNLSPGTYSVHELQPGVNFETVANVGSVDGTATGAAQGVDTITGVTLASGSVATAYDFGVQQPAFVSGRVYTDADGNNSFGSGDVGLAGATVQLTGANNNIVSTTTASDGTYSFTNLMPGTYTLHEVQPLGVFETGLNVGSVGGTTTGTAQGVDTVSGITLASGATGTGYNFAVQQPASISGTDYVDVNGDNSFDSGDTGLQGATIQLLDSTNQVVSSTTTVDASGTFSFTNLTPGVYTLLESTPPSPYVASASNIGNAGGNQVGVDKITGITIGSNTQATGYGFGVQNHTPMLAKYTLTATDVNDNPITSTVTVGQTFYVDIGVQDLRGVNYAGIASGNLDMSYVAQGGGTAGAAPTGNIIPGASYPQPSGASHGSALTTPGLVSNIQGSETANPTGVPFFYTPLGSGVFLLDRVEMIATTAGVVVFNSQFSSGESTIFAELTGANDPDAVPPSQILGGSALVTIVNAPPVPATLAGTVFIDTNGNDSQQTGEVGQFGVTVQLLNSSNSVVATTQSDSSGHYSFSNITPGTYSVHELQPSGLYETGLSVGSVGGSAVGTGSGVDTITGITLGSAAAGVNYNFALQMPATLFGTLYVDSSGDNIQQTNEPGLAGQTVQLIGPSNNVVQSATTQSNGSYSFTNILPGTYSVQEVTPASPYFETGSNLGSVGGSQVGFGRINGVTLASGGSAFGYNFAVQKLATVSGREYIDANGNNQFDSGESGLANVGIQLLSSTGQLLQSTTTAADGTYSFLVQPGTYTLHEQQPGGVYVQTASNIGSAGGSQPAVDTITGITLGSGGTGTDYDFGVQDHVPAQAQVRLAATALDGSTLPAVIPGGETFWLYEYVSDLRQPIANATGVLAAYTNVLFDSSKFQVVSPLTFGADFQNGTMPSGTPSNLHDVGAFSTLAGGNPTSGNQELLVFKVEVQAIGGGVSNIDPDQPDPLPGQSLGVIMVPLPGQATSQPLATAAIHFVGLDGLQTTQPVVASADSSTTITNSATSGALTPITFTVHLSAPATADTTVFYTTQDIGTDNAVPGVDFVQPTNGGQANLGSVVVMQGQSDATFTISAIGNSINQADKTFHLTLSSASNNVVISQTAASELATIHSGVPLPSIKVDPVTGTQASTLTFNVSLSAPSGQVVTVHYQTMATSPQSAIPGTDFEIKSGDIVFNPGDPLTKSITVNTFLDSSETAATKFQFVLTTTSTSNATLATSSAVGTINPLPQGSLSGFVYLDANNNGSRDAGEAGYAGVTILLSGLDRFGNAVNRSTQTLSDGSYSFGGLIQGHYIITEVQPSMYLEGKDHIGTQGGDASVQDKFTVDLAAGVNGTENDFGEGGLDPTKFWWPNF